MVALISKLVRFDKNPFTENFVIRKTKRQIRVFNSVTKNDILYDRETGEIKGTSVVTYKEVDSQEFVKLFANNIGMAFELSSPGIKALNVLLWEVHNNGISTDVVVLDKITQSKFNESNMKTFSYATFLRGLRELVNAQIIARCRREGSFFINPNFCFNGDRFLFATAVKKKLAPKEIK